MRLVRPLPQRWQKVVHEALKFGIVGGINTVINYAVFNALILTALPDGEKKANIAATVVATFTSYLMNRHWTYRDRPKSAWRRESGLFLLFNGAGLLIELSVLALVTDVFGLTGVLALNLAKTGGLVLGTLFRFWSYRTFVFRPEPVEPRELAEVQPANSNLADISEVIKAHEAVELHPTLDVALTARIAAELDAATQPQPATSS